MNYLMLKTNKLIIYGVNALELVGLLIKIIKSCILKSYISKKQKIHVFYYAYPKRDNNTVNNSMFYNI